MDAERARVLLSSLPHVVETMQWGDNLVFWVGDKTIGGKMFALLNLDGRGGPVISFAAGGEHAAELRERESLIPAPYFARIGWIAAERWDALRGREWKDELEAAHAITVAKLSPRTRAVLDMPPKARQTWIAERRSFLEERAATKKERA